MKMSWMKEKGMSITSDRNFLHGNFVVIIPYINLCERSANKQLGEAQCLSYVNGTLITWEIL